MEPTHGMTGMSGDEREQNSKRFLPLGSDRLGQSCPHPCPQHCPHGMEVESAQLGEPLAIREVARLLGCSVWTVRHRYLPHGLPHFRMVNSGKLTFFRNQVTRWILEKQKQKGGV